MNTCSSEFWAVCKHKQRAQSLFTPGVLTTCVHLKTCNCPLTF